MNFDTLPVAINPGWEPPAEEGQLAVDVLLTSTLVIVIATLAGTRPENVSIHLHNDLLTIRGERTSPAPIGAEYFYQECFWGVFSRTIVLPVEVKADSVQAEYRSGVLLVRLAKAETNTGIPMFVIEE